MHLAHDSRVRRHPSHGDQSVGLAVVKAIEPLERRLLFAVIDFDVDGLGANTTPGQIIDNEYANLGITITTQNPANHPAMIFDSANPSGGDTDLGTPNADFGGPGLGAGGEQGQPGENSVAQGRLLVISEDNNSANPDDDANGGTITFTFNSDTLINSLAVIDIENNSSEVRAFDAGNNLLSTTALQNLGNNSFQQVSVNTAGVRRLEVFFGGSGGLPYLIINDQPPPPNGDEGLTPGFWKNHTNLWQGFAPGQTLESVFDVPNSLGLDDKTLLEALNFGGGAGIVGAAKNLFRQAVAALLNSSHNLVEYPLTTAQVITQVNTALASGDKDLIEDLKDQLDQFNNLGGGIDAHGNPI